MCSINDGGAPGIRCPIQPWVRRYNVSCTFTNAISARLLSELMSPLSSGRIKLGQGFAQDSSGALAIGIAAQQHPLGDGQLVTVAPRDHVQVDVEHRLHG